MKDHHLPSKRMWGRFEKMKRDVGYFEVIEWGKMESKARGKLSLKKQREGLQLNANGGWNLPDLDLGVPRKEGYLWDTITMIRNTLWLSQISTGLVRVEEVPRPLRAEHEELSPRNAPHETARRRGDNFYVRILHEDLGGRDQEDLHEAATSGRPPDLRRGPLRVHRGGGLHHWGPVHAHDTEDRDGSFGG